jgi:hypothetical protein
MSILKPLVLRAGRRSESGASGDILLVVGVTVEGSLDKDEAGSVVVTLPVSVPTSTQWLADVEAVDDQVELCWVLAKAVTVTPTTVRIYLRSLDGPTAGSFDVRMVAFRG